MCQSLREHKKNIIGFGNNVLPLTKEELKSHRNAKVCYSCGKKPLKSFLKIYIIRKLDINATIQVNVEAQHIILVI